MVANARSIQMIAGIIPTIRQISPGMARKKLATASQKIVQLR